MKKLGLLIFCFYNFCSIAMEEGWVENNLTTTFSTHAQRIIDMLNQDRNKINEDLNEIASLYWDLTDSEKERLLKSYPVLKQLLPIGEDELENTLPDREDSRFTADLTSAELETLTQALKPVESKNKILKKQIEEKSKSIQNFDQIRQENDKLWQKIQETTRGISEVNDEIRKKSRTNLAKVTLSRAIKQLTAKITDLQKDEEKKTTEFGA